MSHSVSIATAVGVGGGGVEKAKYLVKDSDMTPLLPIL